MNGQKDDIAVSGVTTDTTIWISQGIHLFSQEPQKFRCPRARRAVRALPLRWFHYLAILILTPTETCQRACHYGYWNLRARVS